MKKLFFILIGLAFSGCAKNDSEPQYATYEAQWKSKRLTSYTMRQSINCYCPNGGQKATVVVRNNQIVDVKNASGVSLSADLRNSYKTVDELFAIIRDTDPNSVARLEVHYDENLGYPTSIYIDQSKQIADEEGGYTTEDVQ